MPGFNDRTVVLQAAKNALQAPAGTTTVPAPAPVTHRAGHDHAGRDDAGTRRSVSELEHVAPGLPAGAKELFVRHARKEGRSVAVLRAIDYGSECVVETEVYPPNAVTPLRAGPYTFAEARPGSRVRDGSRRGADVPRLRHPGRLSSRAFNRGQTPAMA